MASVKLLILGNRRTRRIERALIIFVTFRYMAA